MAFLVAGRPCHCGTRRGMNPGGTCYPCPGGEDHLKRRSSSPPVPPLLGCRHCSWKGGSFGFALNRRLSVAPGTCLARSVSAAGGLMPGCRGRSPRRNKLWVSPFPPGRGLGGWGQEGKLKAGAAGDQQGKPPSGTTSAGIASAARVQPRGCKGRSPLHEKNLGLPLPAGKGVGGMGAGRQTKGRGGRRPTRQAPLGHHGGRDSPRRHAEAQAKAGTGRERRLPPIIIRSRKVLGGLGDSFKSPPAYLRLPVSPSPPVRHGDGGRGCRSRRSGRRRGGGRRRRRPRGQRRGGRGTGRSRPCRRG